MYLDEFGKVKEIEEKKEEFGGWISCDSASCIPSIKSMQVSFET